MCPLQAHVHEGRIILNEATSLPEGTVLNLVADDEGDDLDDRDREDLDRALAIANQSASQGMTRSGDAILRELRAGRR